MKIAKSALLYGRKQLPLFFILLLALGLRLWGIGFGLPYKYHIDEAPYVVAALKIASGDFYIDYPFNSPNIYQVLLAAEYAGFYVVGRITGLFNSPIDIANLYKTDPTLFYILARGMSAVLSTGTVAIAYALGKTLNNRFTGLLAALILAVTFIHIRDAHYAVTDTLVTLLVAVCMLGSVMYVREERDLHLALAGLTGGAAVGLKYLPAPVLIVPVIAIILRIWLASPAKSFWQFRKQLLLILPFAISVGFLIAFPALLINPDLFLLHLRQAMGQAANPLGSFLVDTDPAWLYYLRTFIWGLGWPLLITAVLGIAVALATHRPATILLLVGIGCYYLSISVVDTFFARYSLPLIPLLIVIAADGITILINRSQNKVRSLNTPVAITFIVSLLVAYPTIAAFRHNYLLNQVDTRTLAKVWIEDNIAPGTQIVMQWFGPALSTASDLEPNSRITYEIIELNPFMTDPSSYDLQMYSNRGVSYIVINSFNTNLQRADLDENLLRTRFYNDLDQRTQLAAEIRPSDTDREVDFLWEHLYGPAISLFEIDRPGPIIRIYKIDDLTAGLQSSK